VDGAQTRASGVATASRVRSFGEGQDPDWRLPSWAEGHHGRFEGPAKRRPPARASIGRDGLFATTGVLQTAAPDLDRPRTCTYHTPFTSPREPVGSVPVALTRPPVGRVARGKGPVPSDGYGEGLGERGRSG
jgi:hypothetical protein